MKFKIRYLNIMNYRRYGSLKDYFGLRVVNPSIKYIDVVLLGSLTHKVQYKKQKHFFLGKYISQNNDLEIKILDSFDKKQRT